VTKPGFSFFVLILCYFGVFGILCLGIFVIFCCHYQCSRLPGKTVPEITLGVERDVKHLLTHALIQCCCFISDVAVFVLKRDAELQTVKQTQAVSSSRVIS